MGERCSGVILGIVDSSDFNVFEITVFLGSYDLFILKDGRCIVMWLSIAVPSDKISPCLSDHPIPGLETRTFVVKVLFSLPNGKEKEGLLRVKCYYPILWINEDDVNNLRWKGLMCKQDLTQFTHVSAFFNGNEGDFPKPSCCTKSTIHKYIKKETPFSSTLFLHFWNSS